MGIRQVIDEHSRATSATIGGGMVIALIAIFLQLKGPPKPGPPTMGFYTTDDGVTYYKDALTNVPPCDHDGKTAVRAIVIQGANGKTWVAELLRYSARQKAALDAMVAKDPNGQATITSLCNGLDEVKRPQSATAKWVPLESDAGRLVSSFTPPPDITQPAQELEP